MIGCEECKYFDNKCNIENGVSCSNTEIVNGIYNKAIDDFEYACVQLIKKEQDTRFGYLDGIDIREIAKQLKGNK